MFINRDRYNFDMQCLDISRTENGRLKAENEKLKEIIDKFQRAAMLVDIDSAAKEMEDPILMTKRIIDAVVKKGGRSVRTLEEIADYIQIYCIHNRLGD